MGAPTASKKAVLAALAGNSLVFLAKLGAFLASGSAAMLSETIHSAADTGNQLLLFLGILRAKRKGDADFPYGYHGERFVFGLISAAGIFFVGCGVTVYHGFQALLRPTMPDLGWVTFVVLAFSLVVEGSVLFYAVRGQWRQRGSLRFLHYLRERGDPAAIAILLEDGAAVLGVLFAAVGIGLSYWTQDPVYDAIANIAIGLLLGIIAAYLVTKNRQLLLGMAVPDPVEERFVRIVQRFPSILGVQDVKTRQLTPETYQFKAELVFDAAFVVRRLDGALPRELAGHRREDVLAHLAREAIDAVAIEIATIERAIRAEIPEARHIDLEVARPAPPSPLEAPPAREEPPTGYPFAATKP